MEGGMLQQSRFWAIVALFATFAAGGLLGWAVGTRAHGGGPRGWASRGGGPPGPDGMVGFLSERRSEEHTSELQSQSNLVCRLLLEKKKKRNPDGLRDHK